MMMMMMSDDDDLLRISVWPGTKTTPSPRNFQRPTQVHRRQRGKSGALREQPSHHRLSRFHGVCALQRNDNSSRHMIKFHLRCRTGIARRRSILPARVREYNPICAYHQIQQIADRYSRSPLIYDVQCSVSERTSIVQDCLILQLRGVHMELLSI